MFSLFIVYHCGSTDGWSSVFNFATIKNDENWSPRLAFFGDMGNVNAQSVSRLQKDVQKKMYDVILHVGDIAYDLDSVSLINHFYENLYLYKDNGRFGDEFMRQIEPIAAYVPYMTCPGNHEEK